jgi:hypothetical protein
MTASDAMQILRANPDDAATLTEIAFAAKRHWGYPELWMIVGVTSSELSLVLLPSTRLTRHAWTEMPSAFILCVADWTGCVWNIYGCSPKSWDEDLNEHCSMIGRPYEVVGVVADTVEYSGRKIVAARYAEGPQPIIYRALEKAMGIEIAESCLLVRAVGSPAMLVSFVLFRRSVS